MNAQQINMALQLVERSIQNGSVSEKESTLAWQTFHRLSDLSKNARAADALKNMPRVMLKMVRAKDLMPKDVVVGRVGGAWRIVQSTQWLPAVERATCRHGHIVVQWEIESGERWLVAHEKVMDSHYFFVVKQ